MGKFGARAVSQCAQLGTGLRLDALGSGKSDTEIHEIVRRLSRGGLLEYRLARTERGDDMVLESPRADALFRLCSADIAGVLAGLSQPHTIRQLRRKAGFPGTELLALLVDCQIVVTLEPGDDRGLRLSEGDDNLVLWDFHDLLFHARSTNGRHANPSGGVLAYAHVVPPLPAVRPSWPGKAIALATPDSPDGASASALLDKRHSSRSFDDEHPITLAELSRFLHATARIRSRDSMHWGGDDGPLVEFAARPYPSGGASYELELYLAVARCEGVERGFYHYDADRHALVPIEVDARHLATMLAEAQFSINSPSEPQILITIAARFGRVTWKYSAIAYSLILKHVGVLMQTLYLMATDMDLGACALGLSDIDLFARMTGIGFHVEGSVGLMAIGRALPEDEAADR